MDIKTTGVDAVYECREQNLNLCSSKDPILPCEGYERPNELTTCWIFGSAMRACAMCRCSVIIFSHVLCVFILYKRDPMYRSYPSVCLPLLSSSPRQMLMNVVDLISTLPTNSCPSFFYLYDENVSLCPFIVFSYCNNSCSVPPITCNNTTLLDLPFI
jgi:hypothetical protein